MTAPDLAILVFGGPQAVADVVRALPPGQASEGVVVHGMPESLHGWMTQGEPIVCLGVGADGGAALATWLGAGSLDGVAGVGLVGVTAPWAEREALCRCGIELHDVADDGRGVCRFCGVQDIVCRTKLGPLEPLRKVAERAREAVNCEAATARAFIRAWLARSPLRLVVACAPDDGVCAGCDGKAAHQYREGSSYDMLCAPCSGTGKALSSKAVGVELLGDAAGLWDGIDDAEATKGGMTVVCYPSRAELAEHGIQIVIEKLVER